MFSGSIFANEGILIVKWFISYNVELSAWNQSGAWSIIIESQTKLHFIPQLYSTKTQTKHILSRTKLGYVYFVEISRILAALCLPRYEILSNL